jgi:hypothetical protein
MLLDEVSVLLLVVEYLKHKKRALSPLLTINIINEANCRHYKKIVRLQFSRF